MSVILGKVLIAIITALSCVLLLRYRPVITQRLENRQVPWLIVFWLLTRFVPFLAVFIFAGNVPQSDIANYYYPIARAALSLKVLYRDVYCPYSPLFGYWLAIALLFWDSSKALVLLLTLAELLTVWLNYRFYADRMNRGERLFRSLFYLLLPVPLLMSTISGQEDILLYLFTLLAIMAMHYLRNDFLAGVWLALGILSTKAVFILVILPFLAIARKPIRMIGAMALLGLPVALFFYLKTGFLFISQPLDEGTYLKAPNWASILNPFVSGIINPADTIWNYTGLALTILVSFLFVRRVRHSSFNQSLPLLFITTFAIMTVTQKNSVSNYAYIFILPVVFTLVDFKKPKELAALLVFNVLAAIQPSLWFRLGLPYHQSPSTIGKDLLHLAEYIMEVLLVAYFLYLASAAGKEPEKSQAPSKIPAGI